MEKNRAFFGRAALFGTALLWGTSFVILKNTLDSVGTLWILALRFTIAALLLALAAGKRLLLLDRRQLKGGALMGLCLAAAYLFQTYGLKYTTPGKNAFLSAAYCVMVPFLAWGVYRRRPSVYDILAALLCIAGVGFVSLGGSESSVSMGDVLTVICGVFYALQIIVVEQYGRDGDTLVLSTVQFAVAALVCWAGALPLESVPRGVTPEAWMNIAYMGVVCTGLCFFLEAWGIQRTPSSTASMIMSLESVFGVLFSILFYHEAVTVRLAIGFALIFISVVTAETKFSFLRRKTHVPEQY